MNEHHNVKLKPRIKAKWLEALRSGEYKQARRVLRKVDPLGNESFCCLGVLCDLHRKTARRGKGNWIGSGYLGKGGLLPAEVWEWAAKEGSVPALDYGVNDFAIWTGGTPNWLSRLNDDGKSFKQIAKLIEEYL